MSNTRGIYHDDISFFKEKIMMIFLFVYFLYCYYFRFCTTCIIEFKYAIVDIENVKLDPKMKLNPLLHTFYMN